MTARTWKRLGGGYLSADGEWFLVRGARMTHGTNAWLVHQRVVEEHVGRDAPSAYDARDGSPLWTIDADGHVSAGAPADTPADRLYAHRWDAGWLSEAKGIVATKGAVA